VFPSEASREVKSVDSSGYFKTSKLRSATYYVDPDPTAEPTPSMLTTLADVRSPAGVPYADGTVTIDAYSMLPLMQGPDGSPPPDSLLVVVGNGPPWRVYAREDERLDELAAAVDDAVASAAADAAVKASAAQSAAVVAAAAGAATRRRSDGAVRTTVRTAVNNVRMTRAAAPLTVPAYTGDEAVHPSVYYDAAGWNGYRYWMAMTPYEGSDNTLENPSIVVSQDGDTWIVPPGLTNPIEPWNGVTGVYNSDPDLVMVGNTLYMFWRTVFGATNETIYYRTSTDGITWTPKVAALNSDSTQRRLVSPAVLYDEVTGVWTMFVVDTFPAPNTLLRFTGPGPAGPWTQATCTASIPGRDLWHLDVVRWSGELHMLVSDATLGSNGSSGQLYFGVSLDDGLTWAFSTSPILPVLAGAWDNFLYRSAMVPAIINGAMGYDVWYGSGVSAPTGWKIGRAQISLSPHASTTSGPVHGAFDIAHINLLAAFKGLPPYMLGCSFSLPDSASLIGAADTGQAATVTAGTWGITSGKAATQAAGNARVQWESGLADAVLEVDFSGVTSADQVWLIFRLVDSSNYLRLGCQPGGSLILQQIIAGVTTLVQSFGAQVMNSRIRVTYSGSAVSVFLNGVLVGTTTTSQFQTATAVGLQTATTAPRFDNLTCRALVNGA
jgi:hypothetical protein